MGQFVVVGMADLHQAHRALVQQPRHPLGFAGPLQVRRIAVHEDHATLLQPGRLVQLLLQPLQLLATKAEIRAAGARSAHVEEQATHAAHLPGIRQLRHLQLGIEGAEIAALHVVVAGDHRYRQRKVVQQPLEQPILLRGAVVGVVPGQIDEIQFGAPAQALQEGLQVPGVVGLGGGQVQVADMGEGEKIILACHLSLPPQYRWNAPPLRRRARRGSPASAADRARSPPRRSPPGW